MESKNNWFKEDGTPKIKHIIVLVLENRSLEHMFGTCNAQGTGIQEDGSLVPHDPIRGIPTHELKSPAPSSMAYDPPHELTDQKTQMFGLHGTSVCHGYLDPENFVDAALANRDANSVTQMCPEGERAERARDVLKPLSQEQVPIITTLAQNFVLFDHWYCSVPSSTTANRLFFHAATSGGLVTSPTLQKVLEGSKDAPIKGYEFPNGTIYDRLEAKNNSWRIYHGDHLPSVALIHGMAEKLLFGSHFASYGEWDGGKSAKSYKPGAFYRDCMSGNLPDYTFIEPSYGNETTFVGGNSQHPIGYIQDGESLLKNVYETLRNSPCWDSSMLLVTYDETGGFYSSFPGKETVATGDDDRYKSLDFDFKTTGMRVPAILVSPWVLKNAIDHRFHEHSSVPRLVEDRFNLPHLTERDRVARSLDDLLLFAQRHDCVTSLPDIPEFERTQTKSALLDKSFVTAVMSGQTKRLILYQNKTTNLVPKQND